MAKHSTNKSASKRIKVTKNGKVIRRAMGVNHFKTRKSNNNLRKKRSAMQLDFPLKKIINY